MMGALMMSQEQEVFAAVVRPVTPAAPIPDAGAGSGRLAVPRRGNVLTTVAEDFGRPVREAASILTRGFAKLKHDLPALTYMARRALEPGSHITRSQPELLGWSLATMWVTAFSVRQLPQRASLKDAECWFVGDAASAYLTDLLPDRILEAAQSALSGCTGPSAYLELMPYILDPHGPGSRLSIRRDEATRGARDRKRAEGVYYTPADVAEYMVRECLTPFSSAKPPSLLDPACGTAVFLRAALQELRQRWPKCSVISLAEQHLFGTDIDPWALDAAAFVLLADCIADDGAPEASPLCLWHRLRLNLACVDSLRLDPARDEPDRAALAAVKIRRRLATGNLPDIDMLGRPFDPRIPLSRVFAEMSDGPSVVLGNPPYANLGDRGDLSELASVFASLGGKVRAGTELYLLFVEQMIRLASPNEGAGTLVLPLSLACNVGAQFSQTRALIQRTPGAWRFAFFDREPHALFGEDVKTRNTILVWNRTGSSPAATLSSGPMRKWRANRRAEMFSSIAFTPVACDVRAGVPKIDGECQAHAFSRLSARWDRLERGYTGLRRLPLVQVSTSDSQTVFVGPTAYNFLNVFLKPPARILPASAQLSEHPLHGVSFATRQDALAAFAVLSSHLAYWWWHVTADGFHVSGRFIADLPFGLDALTGPKAATLAQLGSALWKLIQAEPVISLNRGRTSMAFSPNGYDGIRRDIDLVLAELAGLEENFVDELQQFTAHTIRAELRLPKNTEK